MKSISVYKIKRLLAHIWFRLVIILNFKNNKKCEELKGKFSGRRVFVIGNGPSLNITPLYLLKGEHVLCFNRFNLLLERLNFIPEMYMVVDDLLGSDIQEDIKQMIALTDYSFFPRVQFGTNITDFKKILGSNSKTNWLYIKSTQLSEKTFVETFEKGFPWTIIGRTVAVAGLQTMMHLGFSEIYILGIDMNYVIHNSSTPIGNGHAIRSEKDDDPNHFDPRYFGKGKKYHQPVDDTIKSIFKSFEVVSNYARGHGYKIYNATIGGKVECFDRVNIYEVLKNKNEKHLFTELVKQYTSLDLDEILLLPVISKEEFLNINKDIFVISVSDINEAIKYCVERYIPLGPYQNKYILIKR